MNERSEITDRVMKYLLDSKHEGIIRMEELSQRAVAAVNGDYKLEVYFDAESYNLNIDVPEKNLVMPEGLKSRNLKMIHNLDSWRTNNFFKMKEYAQKNLEPIVQEADFYETPITVFSP